MNHQITITNINGNYSAIVPCTEQGSGRFSNVTVNPEFIDPRELLSMQLPISVKTLDEFGVIVATNVHKVEREEKGLVQATWGDWEALLLAS